MSRPEQLRLPDELMAAAPIALGKAQTPVSRRGRVAPRLLRAACWTAVLLAFGGIAYFVGLNASSSRRFLIRPADISIQGNHFITREEALAALNLREARAGRAGSIFGVHLTALRQRLEAIPWDESATITRVFPDRLLISIHERSAVAFAAVNGRLELVDRDGVLLQPPSGVSFDFPVVDGLNPSGSAAQRAVQLQPYLGFMASTHDEALQSGWIISEVNVQDPGDLQALLVQGQETVVGHFGDHDFAARFKNYVALAPQVLASYPHVDSIDLRYRGEVVVDPVAAATPDASAMAGRARRQGR